MAARDATRRDFLLSAGVFGAAAMLPPQRSAAAQRPGRTRFSLPEGPESDPPTISRETFREAERLAGISFTDPQREMMAQTILEQIERFDARLNYEYHPNQLAPALTFDPRLPGMQFDDARGAFAPQRRPPRPLPRDEASIAYAPVGELAQWIEQGALTSTRLTAIYLNRLRTFDRQLQCVITLTDELAMAQAARADAEIAAGRYRGPLHGIPWGAKDLLDTAGISTTWGARPYSDRVPLADAAVVRRLEEAGAVLVAKLSLGALAYNDIWFGGRTNNPWNLEQGSSGSSAGSAAATVAGLVGFSIGTETYGSIVSPCMRCGATGLRPTFGRVSRDGAMALCWSLDKIGPICRTVDDCMLVLDAINGHDPADPSSIDAPLAYDASSPSLSGRGSGGGSNATRAQHPSSIRRRAPSEELRVGYNPAWFEGVDVNPLDREALHAMQALGVNMIEVDLPDLPYDTLIHVLLCEAAAAFEELTRTGADELLAWQEPRAWPNTFRQTWFIPGVELVQADRLRRRCMEIMADVFDHADVLIAPSFAASLLLITNNTGHPSLTLRSGFTADGSPHGITLIGRLFDEGTLCRAGLALEQRLDLWQRRPPLFAGNG